MKINNKKQNNISWSRVLLFSVICGVAAGLLMLPAFLKDTSFQEPGINFEFWILAAMIIIIRSEEPIDAGIKTFVFFLISQPLVYLVQVPFSSMHWQLFSYYPRWALITLLTLPAGFIVWYTKKGNTISLALFAVIDALLCLLLMYFTDMLVKHFPYHLISVLFIAAEIIGFILYLFREKRIRIWAFIITFILLCASVWFTWLR